MKKQERYKMYNLVSCYDTLELKSRGDVLSDKVRAIITMYQLSRPSCSRFTSVRLGRGRCCGYPRASLS